MIEESNCPDPVFLGESIISTAAVYQRPKSTVAGTKIVQTARKHELVSSSSNDTRLSVAQIEFEVHYIIWTASRDNQFDDQGDGLEMAYPSSDASSSSKTLW